MTNEEFKNMTDEKFKDLLINDMIEILGSDKISKYSKEHILDMYCWVLTERKKPYSLSSKSTKSAKFKGCSYWTEEAFKQCFDCVDYEKNTYKCRSSSCFTNIKHEHIVPRNLFRKYINDSLACNKIKPDKIREYFIGCVVKDEEATALDMNNKCDMPDNKQFSELTNDDFWSRYKAAGVKKIYKINWTPETRGWNRECKVDEIIEL